MEESEGERNIRSQFGTAFERQCGNRDLRTQSATAAAAAHATDRLTALCLDRLLRRSFSRMP